MDSHLKICTFLQEREDDFRKCVDVDGLIHSGALSSIFDEEELHSLIVHPSTSRPLLFLQRLIIKPDHVISAFMDILVHQQSELPLAHDWVLAQQSNLPSSHDALPSQSSDLPLALDCAQSQQSGLPLPQQRIGNTNLDLRSVWSFPGPMSPMSPSAESSYAHSLQPDGGNMSVDITPATFHSLHLVGSRDELSGASQTRQKVMDSETPQTLVSDDVAGQQLHTDAGANGTTKAIVHQIERTINQLVSLKSRERNDLQNRLNAAIQDQRTAAQAKDDYRARHKGLADLLFMMTVEGKLNYTTVIQSLREMGQIDLADRLTKLMAEKVQETHLNDVAYSVRLALVQELSIKSDDGKDWRLLPEMLDIRDINVDYISQYSRCPAEEILNMWRKKRCATVSNLYHILTRHGFEKAAQILERELGIMF